MKKILLFTIPLAFASLTHAQVTNGLVAKYSFNTGNANDEIGTNHGTVSGATLSADRFGNLNRAYSFDGVNDKIDFGNSTTFEFGQNDFTISLWAKFSAAQFAPLVNKRNDSPNFDQYSISVGQFGAPDNTVGFYYKPSPGGIGGPERVLSGNSTDTLWHNFVVVSDLGDSTSLFIDGQFFGKSSTPFTTENFNITGANLVAGFTNVLGTDYYYNGDLDDLRIYNRALNQLEADSLFNEADPMSVGMNEISQNNFVKIFPNPASDRVNLSANCNITLTDITGKIIEQKQNSNFIGVAALPTGMYFIVLEDENGQLIQRNKLVKE